MRPKGRRKFGISISLTEGQTEFLRRQKNASKLVGDIIDKLAAVDAIDLTEDYVKMLALQRQLDALEEKRMYLKLDADRIITDNKEHFKGKTVTDYIDVTILGDGGKEKVVKEARGSHYEFSNADDPEPIDEKGEIAKGTAAAMRKAADDLTVEIDKVRAELLTLSRKESVGNAKGIAE